MIWELGLRRGDSGFRSQLEAFFSKQWRCCSLLWDRGKAQWLGCLAHNWTILGSNHAELLLHGRAPHIIPIDLTAPTSLRLRRPLNKCPSTTTNNNNNNNSNKVNGQVIGRLDHFRGSFCIPAILAWKSASYLLTWAYITNLQDSIEFTIGNLPTTLLATCKYSQDTHIRIGIISHATWDMCISKRYWW